MSMNSLSVKKLTPSSFSSLEETFSQPNEGKSFLHNICDKLFLESLGLLPLSAYTARMTDGHVFKRHGPLDEPQRGNGEG